MNIYLKSLLFLVIFSILHFGYDITKLGFLKPFCGTDESVFQHLKIAFWSYLLTSLLEFFLIRKKVSKIMNFWYPRFLASITLPWFIFIIWYLAPALFGKIKSTGLEVSWSILVSYFSGLICSIMEKNIEEKDFSLGFKTAILLLLIVSAFLYIWFTYKLPWIDMFVNPEAL